MFLPSWLPPCSISSRSRRSLSFSGCWWQLFPPRKTFLTRCLQLQRNLSFLTVFCIFRFLSCSILTGQQREERLGQVRSGAFGAEYLAFPQVCWVCAEQTSWWAACAGQTLLIQSKTSCNFTLYLRCSRSWGSSGVKYRALWVNKETHLSPFFSLFLHFRSPWTPWF